MGRFGRMLALFAVACALLAAYNVFADHSGLERVAREKACQANRAAGPTACRARLARLRKSPFSQAYVFTAGGTEVQVDCARAYVLLGDYRCERQERAQGTGERR